MALSFALRYITFSFLVVCALSAESVDDDGHSFSFSFEHFDKNLNFDSQIALYGDAEIQNSTVRMVGVGQMLYKKPIRFFVRNPSFLTQFSFSVSKGDVGGLEFLLIPSSVFQTRNVRFFAVKFAADHISINFGGKISTVVLGFNCGQRLFSWIDYDGVSKMIQVRVSDSKDSRPSSSLISWPLDLSNALWREFMYVGISSTNGSHTQISNIYSWSFVTKHGAPYLMHSEPLDPDAVSVRTHEEPPVHVRGSYNWTILVALLIGVACGALVASLVLFLRSKVIKRHPIAPVEYPELSLEIRCEKNGKIVVDGNKVVGNAAK